MTRDPAGGNRAEQQLWNTYVFWARLVCDARTRTDRSLDISKPRNRLRASEDSFLRAVVFVAFALEYRLKSVYEQLGIAGRQRDSLGALVNTFRYRMEMAARLDGHGSVRLPREWKRIEPTLHKLVELRNAIAHGNYRRVLARLPADRQKARRMTDRFFNTFIDVIRVTHLAIGNLSPPIDSPSKARAHYRRLKIRRA